MCPTVICMLCSIVVDIVLKCTFHKDHCIGWLVGQSSGKQHWMCVHFNHVCIFNNAVQSICSKPSSFCWLVSNFFLNIRVVIPLYENGRFAIIDMNLDMHWYQRGKSDWSKKVLLKKFGKPCKKNHTFRAFCIKN